MREQSTLTERGLEHGGSGLSVMEKGRKTLPSNGAHLNNGTKVVTGEAFGAAACIWHGSSVVLVVNTDKKGRLI